MILCEIFTGTKRSRPELDRLMGLVCDGDTVIMTRLDRMARSTRDGLDIIDEFLTKGVEINILNMEKFDGSPSGKLMRTIFLAFAEFERDMIVARTTEGKAICREHDSNWREGRKVKNTCTALHPHLNMAASSTEQRIQLKRTETTAEHIRPDYIFK